MEDRNVLQLLGSQRLPFSIMTCLQKQTLNKGLEWFIWDMSKKILMISNWCLGNTSCYDTTPLIHPRSFWYWNHCNSCFFKTQFGSRWWPLVFEVSSKPSWQALIYLFRIHVYVDGAQTALSQVKVVLFWVLFWVVPLWPLVCLWMQTGDIWGL